MALEAQNLSTDEFARQTLTQPLFATKRLVIVYNPLSQGSKTLQQAIERALTQIPESTVIIFYESANPDKRTSLFKLLVKKALSQEFPPLSLGRLPGWINTRVSQLGARIEPKAVDQLVQRVGPNLWRLNNELEKLTSDPFRPISQSQVERLVSTTLQANVFEFIDQVVLGRPIKALAHLRRLIDQGEPEQKLLALLGWATRVLVQIKDCLSSGQSNPYGIASKIGLAPFLVQKQLTRARALSFKTLSFWYDKIVSTDLKIKTGALEPGLGLELLIMELAENTADRARLG